MKAERRGCDVDGLGVRERDLLDRTLSLAVYETIEFLEHASSYPVSSAAGTLLGLATRLLSGGHAREDSRARFSAIRYRSRLSIRIGTRNRCLLVNTYRVCTFK